MRYLSVCSGIEAATSAWHHLGWEPVAFSEIEPFPSAVLKHHYPNVPNWGDMTQYKIWPDATIDLLVGGTPCQSFSVAGLRKGLEDPRGNLMLTFLGIADRYRPKYIVWENVPGVLSSNAGRDFGSFLGALGELGYVWAYRVLDAQWFGVAQRRRRVFVVGCFGDQRSAAAVLFESEGVSRNTPPSRAKGQRVATDTQASLAPSCTDTVTAKWSKGAEALQQGAQDGGNCIPILMRQREGKDGGGKGPLISEEKSLTLGTSNDQVLAQPVNIYGGNKRADRPEGGFYVRTDEETSKCLDAASGLNPTCSQGGTAVMQPVATAQNVRDEVRLQNGDGQIVGALSAESGMHQTSYIAQPLPFDTTQLTCPSNYSSPKPGDPCHPLAEGAHIPSVAYTTKLHNTTNNQSGKIYEEYTTSLDRSSPPPALLTPMQVRRLTPVECERLQGFPDNHTNIPWRKKAEAPDGPRYKALGNSMAVPVMRWIGERINNLDNDHP